MDKLPNLIPFLQDWIIPVLAPCMRIYMLRVEGSLFPLRMKMRCKLGWNCLNWKVSSPPSKPHMPCPFLRKGNSIQMMWWWSTYRDAVTKIYRTILIILNYRCQISEIRPQSQFSCLTSQSLIYEQNQTKITGGQKNPFDILFSRIPQFGRYGKNHRRFGKKRGGPHRNRTPFQ